MKWWINDCEYWKVISLNCGERRGYESELRSNEHCLCSSVLNCSVHYLSSGEHYCLRHFLHRSFVLVAVVDTKNLDVGKSKLIHEQAIGKRTVDIGWNQPLILNHLFLPEPTWTRTLYILETAFASCKLTEYWLFAPLKSVGYWHADLWRQNFLLECLCVHWNRKCPELTEFNKGHKNTTACKIYREKYGHPLECDVQRAILSCFSRFEGIERPSSTVAIFYEICNGNYHSE